MTGSQSENPWKYWVFVPVGLDLLKFCGLETVIDQSFMNFGFLIEFKISDLSRSKIRQALRCQQHHYYHAHIIHYLLVAQVLFIYRPGIHNLDSARQNLSGPATTSRPRLETYWNTFIHSRLNWLWLDPWFKLSRWISKIHCKFIPLKDDSTFIHQTPFLTPFRKLNFKYHQ